MDKRISLKKIMEQATQEFIVANVFVYGGGRINRRKIADAYDINCGYCEEWAERVRTLYRQATRRDEIEVIDPGNLTGNPDDSLLGHVFIRFRNRYYDAECLYGVNVWNRLPFFSRP